MGLYDVTARKAHQWTMVALVALGFVLGSPWPLAIAGAIMLLGRFWWPADLVRQFVWRVAEPAGFLKRNEQPEDHATRRTARIPRHCVAGRRSARPGQPGAPGWVLAA